MCIYFWYLNLSKIMSLITTVISIKKQDMDGFPELNTTISSKQKDRNPCFIIKLSSDKLQIDVGGIL